MPVVTEFFKPPQGLMPHEDVVWVRHKGAGILGWPVAAFTFLFGATLTGISAAITVGGGSCTINNVPSSCSSITPVFLTLGIVLQGLGVILTLLKITHRDVRYYLTTYRLIQTVQGRISRQVDRSIFKGKPLSRFFDAKSPYMVNNIPVFTVRIMDPTSGDEVMSFRGLQEADVTQLESMAQTLYCQYCGQANPLVNTSCSQCGASL